MISFRRSIAAKASILHRPSCADRLSGTLVTAGFQDKVSQQSPMPCIFLHAPLVLPIVYLSWLWADAGPGVPGPAGTGRMPGTPGRAAAGAA